MGGYKGVKRVHEVKTPRRRVYIRVRGKGIIEADLFDQLAHGSGGEIPPDMLIVCPSCGGDLNIDGHKKHIRVEYLDPPRRVRMPDNGEIVTETALVTVEEPIRCSHPDRAGKGICGWKVKITDSVASEV